MYVYYILPDYTNYVLFLLPQLISPSRNHVEGIQLSFWCNSYQDVRIFRFSHLLSKCHAADINLVFFLSL